MKPEEELLAAVQDVEAEGRIGGEHEVGSETAGGSSGQPQQPAAEQSPDQG